MKMNHQMQTHKDKGNESLSAAMVDIMWLVRSGTSHLAPASQGGSSYFRDRLNQLLY